jgi:hypothetical protein
MGRFGRPFTDLWQGINPIVTFDPSLCNASHTARREELQSIDVKAYFLFWFFQSHTQVLAAGMTHFQDRIPTHIHNVGVGDRKIMWVEEDKIMRAQKGFLKI